MNIKKITSLFFVSALSLLPMFAYAHVKWFAKSVKYVAPYKITDGPVLIWIGITIVLVLFGIFLERRLNVPKFIDYHITKWAPSALSIASIGVGASFLFFSYLGFVFTPNLPIPPTVEGSIMLAVQILSGLMILLGLYERVGALLLIVLYFLAVHVFGASEMIDALEIFGFAIYAFIIGRPKWRIKESKWIKQAVHFMHGYGVSLLRVGTGLNLIVLGFTEKILAPSLTDNFLSTHAWNFMSCFGMTNYWFAFSGGMVEVILGLFLLLGLVTRLTTLVLAGFLITTLVLLGPIELVGHLPHFSLAVIFLILGSGSKFRLVK